jgi:pimeloyl-ACP methyl ester carboxylesterase
MSSDAGKIIMADGACSASMLRGWNGVALAAHIEGPADGMPVLLSHGGGQTRHAWGAAVLRLASAGFRACALDLRGHGESAWAEDGDYRIDAYAGDVRTLIARSPTPPLLVGASLGGIASLLAIGEPPYAKASGLVLVDVSPHMQPQGISGVVGFMLGTRSGFDTIDAAVDAIAAYLPHRPRRNSDGLEKNLRRGDDDRYYWRWDPRTMDHVLDQAAMSARLEAASHHVDVPARLLRGSESELVTADGAAHFMKMFNEGSVVDVPGARHMVSGDRNDAFVAELLTFAKEIRARIGR